MSQIYNGSFVLGDTSATTLSAGEGIKLDTSVPGIIGISNDETLLFSSESGVQNNITLSENIENFDYVRIEWCPFKSNENWTEPYDCVTNKVNNGLLHLVGFGLSNDLTYQIETNLLLACSTTSMTVNKCGTITVGPNNAGCTQLSGYQIYKVIGINRISGGN